MANNSKSIYVDLDDVICNTTERITAMARKEFGKSVSYESLTSFNLQHSFELTDSEYNHFFSLIHEPQFLMEFKPIENSVSTLNEWKIKGYHIDIVTGRPSSSMSVSFEWLKEHNVPFDSLIIVDKYNREKSGSKEAISLIELAQRSYDLAVEDSWDMAIFLSQTMLTPVALPDRPWNRIESQINNVHRTHSWHEIQSFEKNQI